MELSYYYTKHLDYIGCFEGMRYLADFFGGEGAGTDRMPSRSVTKPAFRTQILRDVPPKVAIFDTC